MRHLAAAVILGALAAAAHAAPRPVTLARPKVNGALAADVVTRTLHRHLRRIEHCYERARVRKPTLRGALSATLRVRADGQVEAVRVEGLDNDLENCGANTLRTMRFPAAADTTSVALVFTLRPPPAPKPVRVSPTDLQRILGNCTCPCTCGLTGPADFGRNDLRSD